jgi:hypothetical protein
MIRPGMSRFALQVPLEPRYRVLASEIAAKYVEVLGGAAADADTFSAAVAAAIAALGAPAPPEAEVHLDFDSAPPGIQVTIRCHGGIRTVTHPLPAGKR